jgi:DNA modification methylase
MTTILNGDCIAQMKTLDANSIQTCVTSPPYFGLRDYGHPGQIGLEPTPEDFVAAMVAVFREVRRVLRDDGTLWLNLGDTYAANRGGTTPTRDCTRYGLKHKDLIGIPWRVAFALQADGWYLRQDIIWHKPNPMPESVRDRCTKAHEYIFLLSKSPKYFFDNEAIKVPVKQDWGTRNRTNGKYHNEGTGLQPHSGLEKSYEKANKRSVWSVTTKPYKGAHFATFPPALIEPCILAGSRPGDTVLDPFGGSGTTGAVAIEHGRRSILIELNPEYIPLIQERLEKAQPKPSPQPELFSL